MVSRFTTALTLIVGIGLGSLRAEVPVGKIPYQGRLTNNNNQPLTGSYSIRFSIWDTGPGSGGNELWNETQVLSVDRGLVTANLGDDTVIPGYLFNNATAYLEIKVGADPAMTPRIRLLPSPYSFNTQSFQGYNFTAFVATFSAQTLAGNKTFTGTINPGADLAVGGANFKVTFASNVAVSGTGADALKVSGGIIAGSGNVGIIDQTGKIPALNSSTLADLDGSALTNVSATVLGPGSTNYLQNRNTLQSGATFFVSSGTAQGSVTAGSFIGSGSGVTQLDASNISQGTLSNQRLGAGVVLETSTPMFRTPAAFISSASFSNLVEVSSLAVYGTVTSSSGFTGVGSSLTLLNASNLVSGIIPSARIDPSSIAMYNAQGQIDSFRLEPSSITMFGPVRSRSIIGIWSRINLAASLTDSQLLLVPGHSGFAPVAANSRMTMPFNGIVRGVIASGSAARTAGSATFQVFKNAADIGSGPDAIIDGTNTQYVASNTGVETFVAGDILDIRVTTTSDWLPTTAEWFTQIVVEWTN